MTLGEAMHQYSLDDINHNIECLLFFENYKIKHKYTGHESFFDQIIKLLKKEQKELLAKHKKEWDEDLDLNLIKEKMTGKYKNSRYFKIIKEIIDAEITLTDKEYSFLEQLINGTYKTITERQVKWLMSIYARV